MPYERVKAKPVSAALDVAAADQIQARRVSERLITRRAAAAGALGGLWAGLLTGILFGLFTAGNAWFAIPVAGLGLGVLCGAAFAIVAHLAIRSRRDFGPLPGLSACDHAAARGGCAERARNTVGQAGLAPPGTPAA
jgi:predicted lipid-binding transport protein (Tim44 family)